MKRIFVIITLVLCNLYASIAQTHTLTTLVKTPKGSTVPNAYIHSGYDFNYNSSQLAAYEAEMKMLYGSNLVLLGPPTYAYNCHGYAWHMSDGGLYTVWINTPGYKIYWEDGSYVKVVGATDATAPNGAIVVYDPNGTGDHTAVKISTGIYVSKWGAMGLWQHPPNACPSIYNASSPKNFYVKAVLPPSLSGPGFVCVGTQETFIVNNPPGAYSWVASSNLTPDAGNPGKYTGNANGAGYVSIISGGVEVARKSIWVGKPDVSVSGPTYVQASSYNSHTYYASVSSNAGVTSYNWLMPGGNGAIYGYGHYANAYFYNEATYRMECQAVNTCGSSSAYHYISAYD